MCTGPCFAMMHRGPTQSQKTRLNAPPRRLSQLHADKFHLLVVNVFRLPERTSFPVAVSVQSSFISTCKSSTRCAIRNGLWPQWNRGGHLESSSISSSFSCWFHNGSTACSSTLTSQSVCPWVFLRVSSGELRTQVVDDDLLPRVESVHTGKQSWRRSDQARPESH